MALTSQQIANAGAILAGKVWREAERHDFRPGMDLQTVDRFVTIKEEQAADALLAFLQSTGSTYADTAPSTTLQVNGQPVSGAWTQGSAFKRAILDRAGALVSWEIHQFLSSGAGLVVTVPVPNSGGSYTITILESRNLAALTAAVSALPSAQSNTVHLSRDAQSGLWSATIHSAFRNTALNSGYYQLFNQHGVTFQDEVNKGQRYKVKYQYTWDFRYGADQHLGHAEWQSKNPVIISHTGINSFFKRLSNNEFQYKAIHDVSRSASVIDISATTTYAYPLGF